MAEFLLSIYLWIKALHIIAVISWMAGLLYLPRLFVYHVMNKDKQEASDMLKIMEDKLYRYIMNPAMVASWVFGLSMIWANPVLMESGWMHAKLLLVFFLTGVHHIYGAWRKKFAKDAETKTDVYYRIWNEVPTVLMVLIVFLAILKPF